MIAAVLWAVLGAVFVLYDIVLLTAYPGTLLNTIFSFTHIWALAGAVCIWAAVSKARSGRYFFACWHKKAKIAVCVLLGAGAVISAICLCFILSPRIASIDEKADYVILLGGGIDSNGELSETVMNRVRKAAQYLERNESALCVATGGKGIWSVYPEAPELKKQLVNLGIDEERILAEDKALDTIQNFRYSMRRAERLAALLGFESVAGLGTKVEWYTVPHNYLREIAAYVKLNLRLLLNLF